MLRITCANVCVDCNRFEKGFAVDLNELEKSVSAKTRLIVLTNLHNPTGVLIPNETITAIGEIAARHGTRVTLG